MPIAGLPEIHTFLESFKTAAVDSFVLMPSQKTRDTMTTLGYYKPDVKRDIFNLKETDYSKGPLSSRGYKANLWVFGINISGREIYIKLELSGFSDGGEEIPTSYCVTFHFSEHPMSYPYRQTGKE
jgi:hypothetical protein